MVGGGRGRVRGSLEGTVVCVVKVKLVTYVTEETWRRKLVHSLFILTAEEVLDRQGVEGEREGEGGRGRLLT